MWPDWAIYCTLGNNYFAQIAYILGNFCRGVKIFDFSSEIIFAQLYRHLANFYWSHCHRRKTIVRVFGGSKTIYRQKNVLARNVSEGIKKYPWILMMTTANRSPLTPFFKQLTQTASVTVTHGREHSVHCDQMLEWKVAILFPKVVQKIIQSKFLHKKRFLWK